MSLLLVKNLALSVKDQPILKNVSLNINSGEIQALVGPNGSGKSSLVAALMGQPAYQVTKGDIIFNRKKLLKLRPDQRSKNGLFVAWQSPVIIPGLKVEEFLLKLFKLHGREREKDWPLLKIRQDVARQARKLKSVGLLTRDLNDGLSGGEKKCLEALQMTIIRPRLAVLDEIDSGLDIGSLLAVGKMIRELNRQGTAFLIISHQGRLLQEVKAQKINVLVKGKIVASDGPRLLKTLNRSGFKTWLKD